MEQRTINVGLLGSTGTVGQRFIQLLNQHPFLKLTHLGASNRSTHKLYKDAVNWKLSTPLPLVISNSIVHECIPENFTSCSIIFSGLDSCVAGQIELDFVKAGFNVFSNAKNHRSNPEVPLVVPLVNHDHLDYIHHQRQLWNTRGCLVTNANCSTTGLVVVLKALQDAFGELDGIIVTTLQAISGAGYPGIASLDIIDNVVPFIDGEEDKLETEPLKILGIFDRDSNQFIHKDIKISASCNRVTVIDGHTESVSIAFKNKVKPELLEIQSVLESFDCSFEKTFMTPIKPIVFRMESDRPQPRLDRDTCNGQSVTVGRLRYCNVLDIKLTLLVHNTILGAAGSSILNAEIAVERGLI